MTVFWRRVGGEHVERLRGADAEAVALADGVGMRAAVLAEHGARSVDDRAGLDAEPAVALQKVAMAGAGEEAEVLRVGLARDGEASFGCHLAHLVLVHRAEREAQALQRGRDERGEHVGLVLGDVGGHPQHPPSSTRA